MLLAPTVWPPWWVSPWLAMAMGALTLPSWIEPDFAVADWSVVFRFVWSVFSVPLSLVLPQTSLVSLFESLDCLVALALPAAATLVASDVWRAGWGSRCLALAMGSLTSASGI